MVIGGGIDIISQVTFRVYTDRHTLESRGVETTGTNLTLTHVTIEEIKACKLSRLVDVHGVISWIYSNLPYHILWIQMCIY